MAQKPRPAQRQEHRDQSEDKQLERGRRNVRACLRAARRARLRLRPDGPADRWGLAALHTVRYRCTLAQCVAASVYARARVPAPLPVTGTAAPLLQEILVTYFSIANM